MKSTTLLALLCAETGYASVVKGDMSKRQDLSSLFGGLFGGAKSGGGHGGCVQYSMAGATGLLGMTDSSKGSIGHAMNTKDYAILGALGSK
jgi:hypothetical protein